MQLLDFRELGTAEATNRSGNVGNATNQGLSGQGGNQPCRRPSLTEHFGKQRKVPMAIEHERLPQCLTRSVRTRP